jgi:hypothetical protein
MSRDARAAFFAAIAIVVVIVLGFRVLGGPGTQRLIRSDERTVRSLSELAQKIQQKWRASDSQLPQTLDSFSEKEKQDPLTHKPFVYRPKSNSAYELCATFATDNRHQEPGEAEDAWRHRKGDFCFPLDATQSIPQAPYYY